MCKWLLPVLMGQTVSKERLSEAKNQMENSLDTITNVWLKDKPFITGNEITVADLVAATEIEQLGRYTNNKLLDLNGCFSVSSIMT